MYLSKIELLLQKILLIKYKTKDAVESYRNYYMSEEKQKIASWKKGREKPECSAAAKNKI
jgi:hypothetical protein